MKVEGYVRMHCLQIFRRRRSLDFVLLDLDVQLQDFFDEWPAKVETFVVDLLCDGSTKVMLATAVIGLDTLAMRKRLLGGPPRRCFGRLHQSAL